MRVSLKLSQQGFILVGVPIGLMLIFLSLLLVLLLRVENEAIETDRSKTRIFIAHSLVKQYFDAASQLMFYKYTRNEKLRERFKTQLAGTLESFNQLQIRLEDDPPGLKMLQDLRRRADRGMGLMRKYERYLAHSEDLNLLEVTALYRQFDAAGADFTAKLDDLITYETKRHRASSDNEKRDRTLVISLILLGVILAIATGVILAVFFTRNTVSRLGRLMDNTVRLSKKESLLPALAGDDEIARLDHFFHRMADELAEANRRERAILDNAVDVICSINADGVFTAANPASQQVWGYPSDKLVGLHFSEIIAKEDNQKFRQVLDEIQQKKGLVTVENRVVASDQNVMHMLWSLRWSESERSLFCVSHDISDRKEVERLKQEFVAVISHELRTPLTSLRATLTLLLNGTYGQLSATGEKRVQSADTGISRLIGLINDLLDIEKMEAGKLTMSYADVDLADIVAHSLDAVQGFAEQQEVSVKAEKSSVKVVADSDRMVQVLVNLLSNAIKFSNDGGEVEVRVVDNPDVAELQVIDHGLGIPAGSEQSIFGKYEQAQARDGKKRKGTGLGLPICKAIVEQHGGTIGVRSTDGGGSTFWFRLPQASAS